ncbi:hypothetical protein [Microbulbifer variabilis]|uniref:hypothetical protein n=1 Tax=Microbulbifer variabilis TaxID=266805 RepID=UPI00037A06A0|nr:hypothetical protein [Microbulbifer variabilis]
MPDPKGENKGVFHRTFGVPFDKFIRGKSSAYREIERDISDLRAGRERQLHVGENLEARKRDVLVKIDILDDHIKTDQKDLERQRRRLDEGQARLKTIKSNSPLSMLPRVPKTPIELASKLIAFSSYGMAATAVLTLKNQLDQFEAYADIQMGQHTLNQIQNLQESHLKKYNLKTEELRRLKEQNRLQLKMLACIESSLNQKEADLKNL